MGPGRHHRALAAIISLSLGAMLFTLVPTAAADPFYPQAPTDLTATVGDGQILLTWNAPPPEIIDIIDGYIVFQDGIEVLQTEETSAYLTGLTNGQEYTFTVAAYTFFGIGDLSAPVTVVPLLQASQPSAPRDLVLLPGDSQVTLSWTPPTNDGGSVIEYYVVYMNGVDVAHPTGTSVTVTDLINGQEYRFMVAAHSAAGNGALTTPHKAMPAAPSLFSDPINVAILAAAMLATVFLGLVLLKKRKAAQAKPQISNSPSIPSDEGAPAELICPRCGRPSTGNGCPFCGLTIR